MVDKNEIETVLHNIEGDSQIIENIVSDYVYQKSKTLDDYIEQVKDNLLNSSYTISDEDLNEVAISLPILLYSFGQLVEYAGIKEDIAKALYKQSYHSHHRSLTGTISDKVAYAESQSNKEFLALSITQRVYKSMKIKMESTSDLLTSVKKVISRRMVEFELASSKSVNVSLPDKRRVRM